MTAKKSNLELSEFVKYLTRQSIEGKDRLPSLTELGKELGVSVASLREQFEAARTLGLVEARPRTGIRRLEYSFCPAVCRSAAYAIEINPDHFQTYSDLRNHIEAAYWFQAVSMLTPADHQQLKLLVKSAFEKLERNPVQIPHQEHRDLHLTIYSRLNNVFVIGLLEAYWELYEASGLNTFTDIVYLEKVWGYHKKMVEAICNGDYSGGYQLLMEHIGLLSKRPKPASNPGFE